MVLMAPMDELELREAMKLGFELHDPCAIRYPRDAVPEPTPDCPPFELGKARWLRHGRDATVLCYGVTCAAAMQAADLLREEGVDVSVVNARFARPIDERMIARGFDGSAPVITVEDHSIAGGFGSAVLETAQSLGVSSPCIVRLGIPSDRFIAHGARGEQLAECGYDASGIASAVLRAIESTGGASERPAGIRRSAVSSS